MKKLSIKVILLMLTVFFLSPIHNVNAQFPINYRGIPYLDSIYRGNKLNPYGIQMIPGHIEMAYFDKGGEGIAYHDHTRQNDGAVLNHLKGRIRPGVPDHIVFFREREGVDLDYTRDSIDFNHPNKVDPKIHQIYVGLQEDSEWANYTIYVNQEGKYVIYSVYSNTGSKPAELWVNNTFACNLTFPEITGNSHQWTQSEVGTITFPSEGKYLLTVKFRKGLSFGYLDFLYNAARQ